MMKKRWHISHGRDGFAVEIEKIAWWVEPYERMCYVLHIVTFGIFCCRVPGWAWKVPVGRPKYDMDYVDDEDGPYLENSLGSKLHHWTTKFECVPWDHGTTRLARIPVSRELGISLWNNPADSWLWEDREDEDN